MPQEMASKTRSSSHGKRISRKESASRNVASSPSHPHQRRRLSNSVPPPPPRTTRSNSGGLSKSIDPMRKTQTQYQKVRQHKRVPSDTDMASVVSSLASEPHSKERREPGKSHRKGTTSVRDSSPGRSSMKSDATPREKLFSSTRKAIEDVNRHITSEKRAAKLAAACAEFNHWDESRHNAELYYGAASVLSLALTMTNDDEEIRMISAALEMVFRASQQSIHIAFEKVGSSVVPWMLQILQKCENGRLKYSDATILSITKTFLYFSRVPELRMQLVRHPRLSDALVRVASVSLNGECRITRMKLIANLANCDENKVFLVDHEGLLESILRVAALDTLEKPREYASLVLMDLAAYPANHVRLARSDKLLGTLVKLAVIEKVDETKEAAISALQNLAFCQQNRIRLVSYGSGVVLEALKKTISGDTNEKARRRASGALTNLACDETSEKMANHTGLLETLAIVSTNDENDDVQSRSSMALTKIATNITCMMPAFKTLLDALVVASLSKHTESVSAVLRVMTRAPDNRASMARHPGLLDTLADLAMSDALGPKDRANAMRAIMHLTNDESNHRVMCQKTVLDALITGASLEGDKWVEIQESAIISMERLATDHSNRPVMARQKGLLTAVAKVTERETKLEDEGKESSRERLAKPLLMSLLLAL